MSVITLNMQRCEPDFMLSGTRVDVGVPLLYTKRPCVNSERKVSYPYVLDTAAAISAAPQPHNYITTRHQPRPPDFQHTDGISRSFRPSTVRTERKINSAVSRASKISCHSAVSRPPTIVDSYDCTISQILPDANKIASNLTERKGQTESPSSGSHSQYARLTPYSSIPQSKPDYGGAKHISEWTKTKTSGNKHLSHDDISELKAARELLGLPPEPEPIQSHSPLSGRSSAAGSLSGAIDDTPVSTMSNQKMPKPKRKRGSRRKSGRKSRLKTYNKKSRQSLSSSSVVLESKIALSIIQGSTKVKKSSINAVGTVEGSQVPHSSKSESSTYNVESQVQGKKSGISGSNRKNPIAPFSVSNMQNDPRIEQLIQGIPAMSLSNAPNFKRSTTPRRSYSTTPRRSFQGTRSLDDHASRLVKVYLSQKQSGVLKELGMDYPCAPPATPMPDITQRYEYVPCMYDVKAQREVKAQLEGMARVAMKKKEKEMEVKLKQERQNRKEMEREQRLEQRKVIYALNKVMTEWENNNFDAFCLAHGLNTKSKKK